MLHVQKCAATDAAEVEHCGYGDLAFMGRLFLWTAQDQEAGARGKGRKATQALVHGIRIERKGFAPRVNGCTSLLPSGGLFNRLPAAGSLLVCGVAKNKRERNRGILRDAQDDGVFGRLQWLRFCSGAATGWNRSCRARSRSSAARRMTSQIAARPCGK